MESEATCPVKSTSMQELMAVTFGFNDITLVELTNEMSHMTANKKSMITEMRNNSQDIMIQNERIIQII